MDTTAPETFAYGKRYWYPHMMPADVSIWERFMAKFPDRFDRCQYDVPVGSVPENVKKEAGELGGNAEKLYRKKIDVVAFKNEDIYIIELKPSAGASTVGQIKMYKRLYDKEYSPPEQTRCIIITNEEKADVREFAKDEGVEVEVV